MAFRVFLPGALYLLTLGFGFWVMLADKPYNAALFNVHKLVALAVVVVAAIRLFQILKRTEAEVLVIALLACAALCIVALFASGALMSAGSGPQKLLLIVHRAASFLLTAGAAAAISVVVSKQL